MLSLLLKRIGLGFLTLLAVSLIIFLGIEALPGDAAESLLGQEADPESLAELRDAMGLNQPLVVRYFNWLTGFLTGDLGTSLTTGAPIFDTIAPRLSNSLFLASVTAMVAVPMALVLGILSALYRDSIFDRLVSVSSLAMISTPEFFLGYLLILILAVNVGLFPSMASFSSDASFFELLYAIALPCMTLTLVVMAQMMRMTRAAIIGIIHSPFIEMAHLKGLTNRRIILYHALPNAMSPIINVVALNLAYLVVGVVVVEVVFVYPGLGQLLVDSVGSRDIPVVQASCLVFSGTYVALNILADVLAIMANPRLRHPN
ncbi:MAG: ABC transporter permease [Cognatishimia sp.]